MAASGARRAVGWSAAYLVLSRVATLAAVPLLIGDLGVDLYAIWVLASTLVFSQGLVDFGFGAAIIRYAAVSAAADSRRGVSIVLRRGLVFYVGLSALGAVGWFAAPAIASGVDYLSGAQQGAAVTLIRYMVVAFAVTNLTLLMTSALQGLGHVDASYQARTAGAVVYLPALAVCIATLEPAPAAGIATLAMYGVQLVVSAAMLARLLPRLSDGTAPTPDLRAMISLGARWQVTSWADFSTFQLPRIVAASASGSRTALLVDVALRYGQAVATPLFACYPIVVPSITQAFMREGRAAVSRLTQSWLTRGVFPTFLGAAIAVPLSGPAIEVWTGTTLDRAETVGAAVIAAAMIAFATTGLYSSVMLSIDELGGVIRYKLAQLVLAATLLAVGAWLGGIAVAVGLAVALAAPAAWFDVWAGRSLGVRAADASNRAPLLAVVTILATIAVAWRPPEVENWQLLVVGGLATAAGTAWVASRP